MVLFILYRGCITFLDRSWPSVRFLHPGILGKTARLVDIGEDVQLEATFLFELSGDDRICGMSFDVPLWKKGLPGT